MSEADQELPTESRSRKSSASSSTGSSFEKLEPISTENNKSTEEVTEEERPVENSGGISSDEKEENEEEEQEAVADPLEAPMKPEQEKFYQYEDKVTAIRLLVMFSAAMFTLPLLIMFSMYHYVFRDHYHLPTDQAMLYSAGFGVAVVVLIVAGFVYIAYEEEVEAERKEKKDL